MTEALERQEARARLAEYVLAVVGAWGISLQAGAAPVVYTVLAAAGAYLYLDVFRVRPLPSWIVQVICGAAFVWMLVWPIFVRGEGKSVFMLANLLIVMQAVRFFGPRRMTTGHEIYLVNITLLVVAGAFATGVSFLVQMVAFMVVVLWSAHERLLEAELRRQQAGAGEPDISRVKRRTAVREAARTVAAVTVVGLALGFGLFFVTPVIAGSGGGDENGDRDRRQGRRGNGAGGGRLGKIGFSPQVTLGTVGRLLEDPTPALTVRLSRRAWGGGRLLLRGLTYRDYGVGNWVAAGDGRKRWYDTRGQREVRIRQPDEGESLVRQTITHRSEFGTVLFSIRPLVAVRTPTRRVSVGRSGDLRSDREILIDETYQMVSVAERPSGAELAAAGVARRPGYLNAGYRSSRFKRLAAHLEGRGETDHERVVAVERFLSAEKHFAYTLEFGKSPRVDPVEYFLLTTREGHCAYFASAMVLLLRQMGISARLVTGFADGEYNRASGAYLFRQKHAHAWVEVPYNGYGWVAFDPTPADTGWRSRQGEEGRAAARARRRGGLGRRMKSAWDDWVVTYDRGKQARLFEGLSGAIAAFFSWTESTVSGAASPWMGWLVAAGLLAGGLLWAAAVLRRKEVDRVRRLGGADLSEAQRTIIGFYHRMLDILAGHDIRRRASETASEFADRLSTQEFAPRGPVSLLTGAFERVRYGRLALTAAESAEADLALDELGRALELAEAGVESPAGRGGG